MSDLVLKQRQQILEFLRDTAAHFEKYRTESACLEAIKTINVEAKKVESLELRMCVLGTMKAGKSTFISAILGEAIMPIRTHAMTSLPTEIEPHMDYKVPTLELPHSVYQAFCFGWAFMHRELVGQGTAKSDVQKDFPGRPDIGKLIDEIAEKDSLPFMRVVKCADEICSVLTRMSDLCRVAQSMQVPKEVLEGMAGYSTETSTDGCEIPRIRGSYKRLMLDGVSDSESGKVILVDSPGPNEAGSETARRAMLAELSRASLIVLILDATHLNSQDEASVRNEVQEYLEKYISEERLFVVINKIDQWIPLMRKQDWAKMKDLEDWVLGTFKLGEDCRQRMFGVASQRALNAVGFLRLLEQDPKAARNSDQAKFVAGEDWEEILEEEPDERLVRRAGKRWATSGINPFLDSALKSCVANAAPAILDSAIDTVSRRLDDLSKNIDMRVAGFDLPIGKLKSERECLEKKISLLDQEQRDLRTVVDASQQKALKRIGAARRRLEKRLADEIGSAFEKEKKPEGLLSKYTHKFLGWVGLDTRSSFDTQYDAEVFQKDALQYLRDRAARVILKGLVEETRALQRDLMQLEAEIERRTSSIMKQVQEQLESNFRVTFEPPRIRLESPFDVSPDSLLVKEDHSRQETVKSERSFRYWFWLVPKKTICYQDEVKYVVSLKEVTEYFEQRMKIGLADIEMRFQTFIQSDLRQHIDAYFLLLNEELSRYRNSMGETIENKKLELEEQEAIKESLSEMKREVETRMHKVKDLMIKIKEIGQPGSPATTASSTSHAIAFPS